MPHLTRPSSATDVSSLDPGAFTPTPTLRNHRTSSSFSPVCQHSPNVASSESDYDPNASIAIIGIRGTGLSTLAYMAASALGFRLFDADRLFYQVTGLSRAKYKSIHGAAKYRREEIDLLRTMLQENPSKAVIVCGPGVVETTGEALVAEYAKTHPVIYITRDIEGIEQHLRVLDTNKISNLMRLSTPTLRSVSNFEFHNLSDMGKSDAEGLHDSNDCSPKGLTLKQVEHDFMHLIHSIRRQDGYDINSGSRYFLSSVPVEARPFTYSLSLPVGVPDALWVDIRHTDITADVVELIIPMSEICDKKAEFDHSAANYISQQFYKIRRNIRLPIIIFFQFNDSQHPMIVSHMNAYINALRHGLRLAPEFLCIDLGCSEEVFRSLVAVKRKTKIIAHSFDSSISPAYWDSQDRREKIHLAERLGADVVRLCRRATSIADNFSVRHFMDQAIASGKHKIPIVAFNTGPLGQMSCYFNPTLSPVTESVVQAHSARLPYSSLLTARQAQSALYSSLLLQPMYFGIYGSSVAQSLSPAMHNAAYRFSGMPHKYKKFQYPTIQELAELIKDPRCGGICVTAPFKHEVIPLVDSMSQEAHAIGAVNTLVLLRSESKNLLLDRNRVGRVVAVYGENTDWIGIHACVRRNLSPINIVKRRSTALVVGAGGMARAAIYALRRLGVRTIFLHNRTRANAEILVEQFQRHKATNPGEKDPCHPSPNYDSSDNEQGSPAIRIISKKTDLWPVDAEFPTIIVSCVATHDIGGQSSADTSLPSSWLASPTGGVAIELSYTPLETPLLKQIVKLGDQGWISVDGLQLLPEQGKIQFELFTSRRAPIKLMRDEVIKAYRERASTGVPTAQSITDLA